MKLSDVRKAVAGVLVPALIATGYALTADSDGGTTITWLEGAFIAVAGLSTGSVVYSVRNGGRLLERRSDQ